MTYKFCEDQNFEDYASGRVILHRPGMTNYPVRLAQEIFLRCLSHAGAKSGVRVYDPCCGGAYALTALGFLNPGVIKAITASDYSADMVELAKQNLGLLTIPGLEARLTHLREMHAQFCKPSHLDAVRSAESLLGSLKQNRPIRETRVFHADILSAAPLSGAEFKADIVLTDVPYGQRVSWQGGGAASKLLDNLLPVLKPDAVVAVCSDKGQSFVSESYLRLEKQLIGKRKFEILRLRQNS